MSDTKKFERNMQKVLSKGFSDHEIWVVETWYSIEDEDEDISTERLIALTSDITNTDFDSVMDIMQRFSEKMSEVE